MEESMKYFGEFTEIFNLINEELKNNGQLPIDVLLIDNSATEVMDFISNYAPNSFYILDSKEKIADYFVAYLFKKKAYFDNLSLPNDKLGKLIKKSYSPGRDQHPKTESLYYNESEKEKYLDDILTRLIDCTNMYFSLYHEKGIPILLGDGTRLELQFLYSNLLHILGITREQVFGNADLMKILNFSTEDGRKPSSIEILERIIKDIQTNKDILCAQMKSNLDKIRDPENKRQIVATQLKDETTNELLPYDKIDLKTRAFLNSGPYSDVSAISGLSSGSYFLAEDAGKPDKDREIQQVRISKTDFNKLNKEKVVIDKGNGDEISISTGDYVFNGYTKTDSDVRRIKSAQVGTSKAVIPDKNGIKRNNISVYRKMFNGQRPIPVIGVENPDGGTTIIFTPEQQEEFFMSLYYDFSGEGGMNFEDYIRILKDFTEAFRDKLEKQAVDAVDNGIVIPTQTMKH